MDFLHRAPSDGQWQDIAAQDRTYFQRLADKTNGWVTPGNLVSVLGLAISVLGLVMLFKDQFILAAVLLAVGRLLDVADGYVATKTSTKSPIGEAFDAGIDKLVTFLAVISLLIVEFDLALTLSALVIPQLLVTLLVIYKARQSIKLHPSVSGKISMFSLWLGLVGLIITLSYSYHLVAWTTYAAIGLSIILGLISLVGYSKTAR